MHVEYCNAKIGTKEQRVLGQNDCNTAAPPRTIEEINARANNVAAGINCACGIITEAFSRLGVPHQATAMDPAPQDQPSDPTAFGELRAHLDSLENLERWLCDLASRIQRVV